MQKSDSKKLTDTASEVLSVKNLFKANNIKEKQNNKPIYRSINVINLQNQNELANFDATILPLPLELTKNPINNKINESPKDNILSSTTNNNNSNNTGKNNSILDIMSYISDKYSNLTGMNDPIFGHFSEHSNNDNKDVPQMNEDCLICFEKLTKEEINNNLIECFHAFCNDCFYDYFKEKINSNIDEIKCPEKNCKIMIPNYFIEEKLIHDIPLLSKYKKLKKIKQLQLDPNVKFCPYPNCDSYAIKKDNNFVSCIHNGHKFCFNCLNYWHDKGICTIDIYSFYKKWKNSNKMKRCPKCRYLIEKNEGCNHMTCTNCKYEWCWICKNEYKPGHYELGSRCYGLQYSRNCCSNRFCSIFKQIGMFLFYYALLPLLFITLFPLALFGSLQNKIFEHYHISNKKSYSIIYTLTAFAHFIRLGITFYLIFYCTLIPMIFIPSLRRKIKNLI